MELAEDHVRLWSLFLGASNSRALFVISKLVKYIVVPNFRSWNKKYLKAYCVMHEIIHLPDRRWVHQVVNCVHLGVKKSSFHWCRLFPEQEEWFRTHTHKKKFLRLCRDSSVGIVTRLRAGRSGF
jgi:hypothetical protein